MRKRERELHASRECVRALSVPHIQSVSTRDYYINAQGILKGEVSLYC